MGTPATVVPKLQPLLIMGCIIPPAGVCHILTRFLVTSDFFSSGKVSPSVLQLRRILLPVQWTWAVVRIPTHPRRWTVHRGKSWCRSCCIPVRSSPPPRMITSRLNPPLSVKMVFSVVVSLTMELKGTHSTFADKVSLLGTQAFSVAGTSYLDYHGVGMRTSWAPRSG